MNFNSFFKYRLHVLYYLLFLFGFHENTTFSIPSNDFDRVNTSVDIITSNIHSCKYYDSFIYPQNKPNPTKIFFSLMHLNIRLLQKNFDFLHEFLNLQSSSPDNICLSKTGLKEQTLININISGYSFSLNDSIIMLVEYSYIYIYLLPYSILQYID